MLPGNVYQSFSLLSTSPEFFYRSEHIFPDLSYTVSWYFMTLALMAVRQDSQEVNNFESSVVVQELELAMNLSLSFIRSFMKLA